MAVTNNKVYAAVKGNLVCVSSGKTTATVLIKDFGDLYGKDGAGLNVFDGRVYWLNKNTKGEYVFNRLNLDGTDLYSVVFKDVAISSPAKLTFLNKMIVAKDGIYFCMDVCDAEDNKFAVLYRLDHNFNIDKSILTVSDFAIIKDKIYCISGSGNAGHPWVIDRSSFKNMVDITNDWKPYDNIYSFGEYIVLDAYSTYASSVYSDYTDLIVMDTASGEIVRRISAEKQDIIDIYDVSDYNSGTVLIRYNSKSMIMNVKTGTVKEVDNHNGTVLKGKKYFIQSDSLYVGNLEGNSKTKIY